MNGKGAPCGDAPAQNDPLASPNAVASAHALSSPAVVSPSAVGAEPVFREPWEAQAFAMTVLLHERGLFTWGEWAQALGAQIASAVGAGAADASSRADAGSAPPPGIAASALQPAAEKTYYQHWLAALESLVAAKGASSADELTRYQRAWEQAAHRTPHGQSIDLQPRDLGG